MLQLAQAQQSLPESAEVEELIRQAAALKVQGNYGEAARLWERVLAISEQALGLNHPITANSLGNLAVVYLQQGRYGQAEPLLLRVLAIREQTLGREHPDTATTLGELALIYQTQSRDSEARPLLRRLNPMQADWLRRELPLQPRELRSRQLAVLPPAFFITFALLEKDPGAVDLALETRLNRQGLLAEIEQRQRLLASGSPQTRALSGRIAELDGQLASVSLPLERRPALRQERQRLERELYRMIPALRIEPVSNGQVAAALRAAAARGVLVEFQKYRPLLGIRKGKADVGNPRYVALLLKPDGSISTVPLGEAAPIDAAIARALTASSENVADAQDHCAQVSRLLLEPLQRQLAGSEELFLSPDGDLHRIPFAALPAPGQSGRLLSETFRLRLLTTGRDLVRLQRQQGRGAGAAVVMAAPDYGAPGRSPAPRSTAVRGEPQRRSGDLGPRTWMPLPATAEEAGQLAPLLQAQRPITGADATAARALQQKGPRIFHIATHGYFEPDQPDQPARQQATLQPPVPPGRTPCCVAGWCSPVPTSPRRIRTTTAT